MIQLCLEQSSFAAGLEQCCAYRLDTWSCNTEPWPREGQGGVGGDL